jgi:hypothetical protein
MSRDRGVPCPRCGGDDRFAVNERKNVFICRGGDGGRDVGGDAIALAQHLDGTDFLVACETVTGEMVLLSPAVDKQPLALPHKLAAPEDDSARLARARRLWGESVGPRETLVEKYLAPRLVALTDDIAGSVLRFHGAVPWREANETIIRVPAMLAVYRHILSDEIVGVQVTRLSPAGEKIDGCAAAAATARSNSIAMRMSRSA